MEQAEQEQLSDISGEYMLESVFHLIVTATKQIAEKPDKDLASAKLYVADYLERIVNGLRDQE
jgi:hypothetical protein